MNENQAKAELARVLDQHLTNLRAEPKPERGLEEKEALRKLDLQGLCEAIARANMTGIVALVELGQPLIFAVPLERAGMELHIGEWLSLRYGINGDSPIIGEKE